VVLAGLSAITIFRTGGHVSRAAPSDVALHLFLYTTVATEG
jgi:hypothetical protein